MTTRDAPTGNDRKAAGARPSKQEIAAVVVLYERDPPRAAAYNRVDLTRIHRVRLV
jgi:hypothetical protein